MSIRDDVFEAMNNSLHNTSMKEIMDKSAEEIANELQYYTTGFEEESISNLKKYIIEWKLKYSHYN